MHRGKTFDAGCGVLLGDSSFVAARDEAYLRFGERRLARGLAVRLALTRRMRVARAVRLALRFAAHIAGFAFCRNSRREFGLRGLDGLTLCLAVGAGMTEFSVEVGEAVDPICGMTVSIAGARETVVRDGTTYYFCGAGCRRRFEEARV